MQSFDYQFHPLRCQREMFRLETTLKVLFISILFAFTNLGAAEEVERIPVKRLFTALPQTSLATLSTATSKDAVVPWIVIGSSTGLLYHYDQQILDETQREGRDLHIGNADHTKTVIEAGPYPLLRLPSDLGSTMYFLGDGWTHFTIAGSFYLTGERDGFARAHNTGLEIVHGMIVSTMFSQAIKRSTGRESPSLQSEERGKWRPFPSVAAYGRQTPKYDAFPSGHVMTATLTFTIINENYPEYSNYIIPIGVTWVSALAWQMMNNGVHWASDYPLAIGLGYVVAKASTQMGKQTAKAGEAASNRTIFLPTDFDGAPGFMAVRSF